MGVQYTVVEKTRILATPGTYAAADQVIVEQYVRELLEAGWSIQTILGMTAAHNTHAVMVLATIKQEGVASDPTYPGAAKSGVLESTVPGQVDIGWDNPFNWDIERVRIFYGSSATPAYEAGTEFTGSPFTAAAYIGDGTTGITASGAVATGTTQYFGIYVVDNAGQVSDVLDLGYITVR